MKFRIVILILTFLSLLSCSASNPLLEPDKSEIKEKSPDIFKVEFVTSKGNFIVEAKREYSPLAVDRFYYLVKNNYYSENRFFRVLPNFVVQWGMKGIPEIDKVWQDLGVADEPVKLSNEKGSISFARGGPNTRSNQLFINLADNKRLDESDFNGVKGFPAFGKVIKGIEIVEAINSEYLQEPNQDSISTTGNDYLNKNFPNLDYIISTKIIFN
ncbi:MAG: peptidylprolyl isomerase [Ignavibacteriales bacterium]|nr:peptidylprolyl isomerase [Ignavibacteriales bacterium]MBK7979670.1 peptidylprolyl isomerase [Ignavibacteriota bacterium]